MATLRLCSSCRRHVLGADAPCPFCGTAAEGSTSRGATSRGAGYVAAAVAAAAGLAVTATTLGCVYGAPDPLPDSGTRPDAAATDASAADDGAAGDDDAAL